MDFFPLTPREGGGWDKASPLCPAHSDFLAEGTEPDSNQVEPEGGL